MYIKTTLILAIVMITFFSFFSINVWSTNNYSAISIYPRFTKNIHVVQFEYNVPSTGTELCFVVYDRTKVQSFAVGYWQQQFRLQLPY